MGGTDDTVLLLDTLREDNSRAEPGGTNRALDKKGENDEFVDSFVKISIINRSDAFDGIR